MGTFKRDIQYFSNEGATDSGSLTDIESMTIRRGLEVKNNTFELTLKNPYTTLDQHKYVKTDGTLIFQENDVFKFYMNVFSDNTTLDTTSVDSSDLVMTADMLEVEGKLTDKKSTLKLKGVDKTYSMLSQLWSQSYTLPGADIDRNSPEIMQNILRLTSGQNTNPNSFDDNGAITTLGGYEIDSRLFTEGVKTTTTATSGTTGTTLVCSSATFSTDGVKKGFLIKNTTTYKTATVVSITNETTLVVSRSAAFTSGDGVQVSDGFIQDWRPSDGSAFPDIAMGKRFKPVSEWIEALSAPDVTNTSTETIATTYKCDRKMVSYIDEKNRFHWFYPDDSLVDYNITAGTITATDFSDDIVDVKMKFATYDVINMVIFNGGKDMYGVGNLFYHYEPTSSSTKLKMKYVPMLDVSETFIEKEIGKTNLVASGTGVYYLYNGERYARTASTLTATFDGKAYTTDKGYNDGFRAAARTACAGRAQQITKQRGNPRWKGSMRTRFSNFQPGEVIKLTVPQLGIKNVKLRINDVMHQIMQNSVTTSINLEEDDPAMG